MRSLAWQAPRNCFLQVDPTFGWFLPQYERAFRTASGQNAARTFAQWGIAIDRNTPANDEPCALNLSNQRGVPRLGRLFRPAGHRRSRPNPFSYQQIWNKMNFREFSNQILNQDSSERGAVMGYMKAQLERWVGDRSLPKAAQETSAVHETKVVAETPVREVNGAIALAILDGMADLWVNQRKCPRD